MTTLDQDLKIASEANKFCDDPIAIESDVMDDFFSTFTPEKVKAYIKVAMAGQEIGREYLKCDQNPHNDPVVRWREIRRLVDALKELEK